MTPSPSGSASSDPRPGAPDSSSEDQGERASSSPESRTVRALGFSGGLLALIAVACGMVMLVVKAAGGHPSPVLTQMLLLLLPLAFVELMAALLLEVRRRRRI